MKVLLIAPPKRRLEGSEVHPPVGLGYLATALRNAGHTPEIQDTLITNWSVDETVRYVLDTKPDVVGITLFSQAITNTRHLLAGIKRNAQSIVTIVGGPHPTGVPDTVMDDLPDADYAFSGEGEIGLVRLLDQLNSAETAYPQVPGLIWRQDGATRFNARIEHEPVDDFGFPAWDLIDPRRYFTALGGNCAILHTSRGCPFDCQFCVKLGRKVRYRTLDHIFEEMKMVSSFYGVSKFFINDEGFPINPKFVKQFCKYIISKNTDFEFLSSTGLRLNVLDDEMLELMKQARFDLGPFGVGIESGVPRVRELMKKSLSQDAIFRGIELLNKHGFKPSGNFILGFPGETRKDMLETIRLALTLKIWGASFTPFIPLPGSPATRMLQSRGEIPKDFDFSRIDLDCVLYAPQGMTTKEVDRMRKVAVFLFNIRPRMLWHHMSGGRLWWSVTKVFRIFMPRWMTPRRWRRDA